ncbi:sulfatase-like hydrolase/transferase [Gammaproteobacteria bacterium]|nr:sulfatase-like hydrolase/transferase [Gammaproteobacteria bacterium]MDC3313354.1 sulfatase-like hydrolase/transferase [Gammaproteobacteria bacterium]
MPKKLTVSLMVLIVSGFVAWEYKVNILVWAIPKVSNVTVQENIPTTWSEGPDIPIDDNRPNIILILADDMGYNDISIHNGGAADGTLQTKNIDALAKSGMLFSRGYAANATCAPSRASIMTGKYSTRFGYEFTPIPSLGRTVLRWLAEEDDFELKQRIDREVVSKMPSYMEQGMPNEQTTIAEVLKDAGYYTAHIGKWHLGYANGMDPISQGFQDSLGLLGPLYLPEDHPNVVNAKFDTRIDKMIWGMGQYSATFNNGNSFAPDKYVTDYYTDEALKVIENNKNRPFFLYLSHWAIHNPLQSLRSDFEQMSHMHGHNLQVYSGMINALDRSVGKIVGKLKDLDIYGKTLIIFTSDNGGANYIELDDINKPYRGWKISFFEGGIRVPYIVSWPDEIGPGKKSDNAVHHFDIFPTIAKAAGIESSDALDGVDLLPFIKNESSSKPHTTLFWRSGNHQSVLHKNWKYIISKKENFRWLFDTSVDPTEKNNLLHSHTLIVKEIEELLAKFNSEQKNPLFPSSYDAPIMIDKYDGKEYEEGDEYIYWSN